MFHFILIGIIFSTTMLTQDYNLRNSLKEYVKSTAIIYKKCTNSQKLTFKPFPVEYIINEQPCNPELSETFILHIPHGKAYSEDGIIIHNDHIFKELIWQNDVSQKTHLQELNIQKLSNPIKIKGRVAVISQNGQFCYYHWMTEVLGRLLLLESQNIAYDYLVVPINKPFMRESLELLGIDMRKVIEPYGKHVYIQADELIVPSLINQVYPTPKLASYPSPNGMQQLKDKFLPIIKSITKIDFKLMSKKIFISRQDSSVRQLTNEDELFEKLKDHGFQRYRLSELSLLEQIGLFYHADVIVALHGAGLTNLIFSKPGTRIIELFQARADATYWYASQTLNLNYTCIQTCKFDQQKSCIGFFDTTVSEQTISKIMKYAYNKT